MSRVVRVIEGELEYKFGFTRSNRDDRYFELALEGIPTIRTKVSHGAREISRNLEGKIARQLRVRVRYYRGMMDCTHDREEYYRKVREEPFVR